MKTINRQMKGFLDSFKHTEASKSDSEVCNVTDYRSFDIHSYDSFFNESNTEKIKINENDFIEAVAYDYYSDVNMWDLVLIMNNRDAITDMPYDSDLVVEIAEEIVSNYFYNPSSPYQGTITNDLVNAYRNYIVQYLTEKNMDLMSLRVLKNEYLGDFLRTFKYV